MMHSSLPPWTIGWKETIDLVAWRIKHIKVKIDTGARTSAIDVSSYEMFDTKETGLVAELRIALDRSEPEKLTIVRTPVLDMVLVRNTSGQLERRPLVETTVRLGVLRKTIRLTIANRACMRFRMILGRTALANDFIVDVSQAHLLRKH